MMHKAESLDDMMREVLAARGVPISGAETEEQNCASGLGALAGAFTVPSDAESYHIGVPSDFVRDTALEAKARQWFRRAGLPQSAVSGIIREYCRQLCHDEQAPNVGDRAQRTQAELVREWGADYPRKIAAAQTLIAKSGGADELAEILGRSGLGDNAWLIRTLAALAELDPNSGADK